MNKESPAPSPPSPSPAHARADAQEKAKGRALRTRVHGQGGPTRATAPANQVEDEVIAFELGYSIGRVAQHVLRDQQGRRHGLGPSPGPPARASVPASPLRGYPPKRHAA